MKQKLKFEVDRERIFNLLDCKKESENYSCYLEVYERVLETAKKIIHPVVYYDYFDADLELDFVRDSQGMYLCFVTLNKEVESCINKMFEKYEYLEAMMLNGISDQALFNASKQLNSLLRERELKKDATLIKRGSPGDYGVPNEYQKNILNRLNESIDIDVKISSAYMVTPGKSLTYVYGVSNDKNAEECIEHDCINCKLKECKYKNENKCA